MENLCTQYVRAVITSDNLVITAACGLIYMGSKGLTHNMVGHGEHFSVMCHLILQVEYGLAARLDACTMHTNRYTPWTI